MSTETGPGTPGDVQPELPRLAEIINELQRAHQEAVRQSLARAVEAGGRMHEAKALLPRGAWIAWVEKHLAVPQKTAREYMRLFRFRERVRALEAEHGCLTIHRALALLSAGPGQE